MIRRSGHDAYDNVLGRNEYEYGENGRVKCEKEFDSQNNLLSCAVFDSNGDLSQYEIYTDGKLSSRTLFDLTKRGMTLHGYTKKTWEGEYSESSLFPILEYTRYDEEGNQIN